MPSGAGCLIRPLEEADLEEVLALERSCHRRPWSESILRRELANPVATVDLCWQDKRLAGYLCSWYLCGELEVHNLTTAPAFRRRGVARLLLRHVFGRCRGLERAFLEVRAGNVGAIALYRKFGFRFAGRRADYYEDGEDALLMEIDGRCWRESPFAQGRRQEK